MPTYRCTFETHISLAVDIDVERPDGVDPEDWDGTGAAADAAWRQAEDYLQTLHSSPSFGVVSVDATLDGIGADEVEEVAP